MLAAAILHPVDNNIAAANSSDFAAAMSLGNLTLFRGEWASDVKGFVRGIDALQTSRVTQCLLAHMLHPSTFQPIKDLSHFGYNICRRGFPLDSGNIAYALVFAALEVVAPMPREYELVVRTPVSLCELLGALRAMGAYARIIRMFQRGLHSQG